MSGHGRSPNYVLKEIHRITNRGDFVDLPAGAFVRPINFEYVPKHVVEDSQNRLFDPSCEVFCYTRYGIKLVPKRLLREV